MIIDIAANLDETGKVPYMIYYETNSKREELGYYATEERAKEVLQEIIKSILYSRKIDKTNNIFGFDFMESNAYFEMPEK